MTYSETGSPELLEVSGIEVLSLPAGLGAGKAESLWEYEFWENLSAAEYARRQGVEPVNDVKKLYGSGVTEDWEGFNEALDQWRTENPTN